MEIVFKVIRIGVPLTVEIAVDEPVRLENFLRDISALHADCVKEENLKLIVGESVIMAGADVIETTPEILGDSVVADLCAKASAVFNRCPFEHTVDGYVIHDGIHVFENIGVKYAGLTKRYPIFKT